MNLDPEHAIPAISVVVGLFFFLFWALITALYVWAFCRIFAKAGYSWALGLLMLVPIANFIMPFILAFGEWPIHRRVELLRQQQRPPVS
jgi:hypothetical protein